VLNKLFAGLDIGTGGVRGIAADEKGRVIASSAVDFNLDSFSSAPGTHEQSPEAWWLSAGQCLSQLTASLVEKGYPLKSIQGISVDGTSGTLVCLDKNDQPVRPGIMYNDPRGQEDAEELNSLAGDFCRKLGYRFKSSFALASILWLSRHEKQAFERTRRFIHQADYISGRLTGHYGITDYSNALKTGYDLVEERWPEWLSSLPGILERLPEVIAPGQPLGVTTSEQQPGTGLPAGVPVFAGASDGTAACLASGLSTPGDFNTTYGSTLVFKGLSNQICSHPKGLIYSHKLPGGLWLPGAASNTGCEWIEKIFPGEDIPNLDKLAVENLPSDCLVYPLQRKGERFPFDDPGAQGFCLNEPEDSHELFAACLQGTAFVERLGYEVLDKVASTSGGEVFSTGGGSASQIWMQCRADVTGRVLHRPACAQSAFGSAVLAATGAHFGDLKAAVQNMVSMEKNYYPTAALRNRYDDLYHTFLEEISRRGYL
jgi:xylulokinase